MKRLLVSCAFAVVIAVVLPHGAFAAAKKPTVLTNVSRTYWGTPPSYITGTLRYKSSRVWRPLARNYVYLDSAGGGTVHRRVRTNSKGYFKVACGVHGDFYLSYRSTSRYRGSRRLLSAYPIRTTFVGVLPGYSTDTTAVVTGRLLTTSGLPVSGYPINCIVQPTGVIGCTRSLSATTAADGSFSLAVNRDTGLDITSSDPLGYLHDRYDDAQIRTVVSATSAGNAAGVTFDVTATPDSSLAGSYTVDVTAHVVTKDSLGATLAVAPLANEKLFVEESLDDGVTPSLAATTDSGGHILVHGYLGANSIVAIGNQVRFDGDWYLSPDAAPDAPWFYVLPQHLQSFPPAITTEPSGTVQWAMVGHDAQRTHRSQYAGTHSNHLKWEVDGGYFDITQNARYVYSAPAVAPDGTICVNSGDGKLYSYASDAGLKWALSIRVPAAGNNFANQSPLIGPDGTIYVVSECGVGGTPNVMYAVHPDGTIAWTFSSGSELLTGNPAVAPDGTVYVSSFQGNLFALNPDGTVKWSYALGGATSDPALGSDGTIYITHAGTLYAIGSGGALQWSAPCGVGVGGTYVSPAVGADGTIYVSAWNRVLYAFHSNGTPAWNLTVATDGESDSPAIGADGTIYVGTYGQTMSYVSAVGTDGVLKWRNSYSASGDSVSIGSDGTLYVDGGGTLFALDRSGQQLWTFTSPTYRSIANPVIGKDGTIYIGGDDGKLYAIGQ